MCTYDNEICYIGFVIISYRDNIGLKVKLERLRLFDEDVIN